MLEVVGKAAKVPPEQIGFICVKFGVTIGFTVIVIVVLLAFCPASGVKVYRVVAILLNAGDQVPTIPLLEVVGKAANVAPKQIGDTWAKVGVVFGFTTIVIVATEAHCPAFGVNVYNVVVMLFNAGDQVPVIPLVDVAGKSTKVPPMLIGDTCVNAGVTTGLTVIVIVATEAHCPEVGVKVYKVVAVLFKAGDQVPTIPLLEVVGSGSKLEPAQMGGTCVKTVVIFGEILIVTVVEGPHCPTAGVKV